MKRRPPLTVMQVSHLEGIVLNAARKSSDRVAAGCFLMMVFGCLRFSDLQRTSKLAVDAVTNADGSESGYLV